MSINFDYLRKYTRFKNVTRVWNSGMFGGAMNLPNFIVDRLCATLLPVRYEAKGNRFPLIAITMIFTQVFNHSRFSDLR